MADEVTPHRPRLWRDTLSPGERVGSSILSLSLGERVAIPRSRESQVRGQLPFEQ